MRAAIVLALACLVACAAGANAAPVSSLEVAPTTLELTAGEPGLLYIANHSSRPITVQIDVYDWLQSDNADRLVLSESAFVSPPLTTIAPGERQIVRLLAQPRQSKSEAAYRVRISELPDPGPKASGVQVLLQFSIPVFVRGSDGDTAVAWTATDTGSAIQLAAHNAGGRAVKLAGLSISATGVAPVEIAPRSVSYLLPDTSRVWSAPLLKAARLHIAAVDERSGESLAADVTVVR
jgi:fimbrial chaperone protein